MIGDCRLPRSARLSDAKTIRELGARARARRGRWFVVRHACNAVGFARLAVRVGKKAVRAAVGRNRMRRLVRETFRLRRPGLPACDYLVTVRGAASDATLREAREELERLLAPA